MLALDIIKKGLIKVPTQPENSGLRATAIVFKSYDKEIALEMHISKQDGAPADLLGANIRLLMNIYDEIDGQVVKEPIPFITKNVVTESYLHGVVKYILPEALKAYNGTVETFVYVEYPDGSSSDNLAFTFRMERSKIDGIAQDKADYFIQDFQDLLAEASLQAGEVIEGLDTQIKELQQVATDATNAANDVTERIDGLEAEIEQLERLREMYIDTLDFEGYDYSGRPNLAPNLDFSKFSGNGITMTKPFACFKDHETYLELDSSDPSAVNTSRNIYVPNCSALLPNNTYIMTVPIMINADFDDFRTAFVLKTRDGTALGTINPPRENVGTWQNVTKAFTVPSNLKFDTTYLQLWQPMEGNGKIYIGYDIKIEKVNSTSDTATPFQPNLLAEPYNMCREYPNENIADPTAVFPISTSDYLLYNKRNIENYEAGQTYTLTMKATKSASQSFRVFIMSGTQLVGTMMPAEGKVDEWEITFTVSQGVIDAGTTNILQVYQYPNTSLGAVQIDWLKIEKGNTRTPINVPTYKGLGILDTNDPTKYVWNYTELVDVDGIQDALEHVEQRTLDIEDEQEKLDGRLTNVNSTLNTVQSTADQILAEVTAADVMKETDLPSYLANKPIVAGGMADFAGKVSTKLHPNPHKCANYVLEYISANQVPSKAINYETTQSGYNNLSKLDNSLTSASTNEVGKTANLAFKFDLISQITKDFPSFFDDCPTQETKVVKIRKYINGAVLTFNAKGKGTPLYTSVAKGDTWNKETPYDTGDKLTEVKHNPLKGNAEIAEHIQSDGSIIFRTRTKTANTGETFVIEMDYVRFDYTLDLSSDDFITPIERDVTKGNLTQILSDDSTMIKGVMDFKGKSRGDNTNCPHAAYEVANKAQATQMSQITYEAESAAYNSIQNKNDGLARFLVVNGVAGNAAQAKYKFDLVTAIEKEYPHLFKGLTTTKQKVDVLKAKIQELKFNIWCRTEDASGYIRIGSSLSNVDTIDTLQVKDVGQTAEFARAEFYSDSNYACARRINDDGTILYFMHGTTANATYTAPKVIIDYVNLEYTLSDKPSDYVVKKDDPNYTGALTKLAGIRQYATQTTSVDDSRDTHGAVYVGGNVWLAWDTKILESSSGFTAGNYKQFGTEDLPMFDFPDITTDKSGYMFLSGVAKAEYTNSGFGDYQISIENCFNDARKPIVRFIKTPSTPIKKVFVTVYALIFAAKPTVDQEITL